MKRTILETLKQWKNDTGRRPLLMRGARQVGKTYIVEELGKSEFKNIVTINFERNAEYKEVFSSLDPAKILEKITLLSGEKIVVGETLLFLDEIQECPRAISSLRYFYEEKKGLHVIGAGSLLEFALGEKEFRMPVGRVQYLYLQPLSFIEFLDAVGENALAGHIADLSNIKNIPEVIHEKLIGLIKDYFVIGGMPSVVAEYISSHDIIKCQNIQRSIIDTYIDDFAKYANKTKMPVLQKVFNSAARMIGQKFVYSHVDNTIKSYKMKEAVNMLEMAGVLIRIKRSNGDGLPLEANVKDNFFKLLFLDVGLLHNALGIYRETILSNDLSSVFRGAVAEQFIGQELAAYQDFYHKPSLYYWAREAKNSNAELDYIFEKKGMIIPVEVKSGKKGKYKSLKMYIDKYHPVTALKVSQEIYEERDNFISLPFYGIYAFMKE